MQHNHCIYLVQSQGFQCAVQSGFVQPTRVSNVRSTRSLSGPQRFSSVQSTRCLFPIHKDIKCPVHKDSVLTKGSKCPVQKHNGDLRGLLECATHGLCLVGPQGSLSLNAQEFKFLPDPPCTRVISCQRRIWFPQKAFWITGISRLNPGCRVDSMTSIWINSAIWIREIDMKRRHALNREIKTSRRFHMGTCSCPRIDLPGESVRHQTRWGKILFNSETWTFHKDFARSTRISSVQ